MTGSPFKSATIPRDRLLPGIHGLRGLAALAVVLYHLTHLAHLAPPEIFAFIISDFGYGVHLFFVLSAFSLMYSTEHTQHRPTWMSEYFIKRFWRIAPLYYFIMAVMISVQAIRSHVTYDIPTILMNLSFTFNFAPWSGIVWGGWAVGVEMLFYAVLPVLLLGIRTTSSAFLLVLVSLLVSYAIRSTLHVHYESTVAQYGWNWDYFSFGANLSFFALGIYAYRLSQSLGENTLLVRQAIPLFTVSLLGILMLTEWDAPLKGVGRIDLMLWGIGFAALCIWQKAHPSRWAANRFLEYVGERSYSTYLLHPILIVFLKTPIRHLYELFTPYIGTYAFFLCGALIIALLLLLSELTYRMIELPGIRSGQRINKKQRLHYESKQG